MTDGDELQDRVDHGAWFMRPAHGPLARRVGGRYVLDPVDWDGFREMSPCRKLLFMLLALCVKDRASRVSFEKAVDEAGEASVRMTYQVDGADHELVPPPRDLMPEIHRDLSVYSGATTLRRRLGGVFRRIATRIDGQAEQAAKGTFLMAYIPPIEVSAILEPLSEGGRIELAFPVASVAQSDCAARVLRDFWNRVDAELNEVPDFNAS